MKQEYIDIFFTNNKSGNKSKESYLKNNYPELHSKILSHCESITTHTFTEKIWYFINEISKTVECSCGSKTPLKFDTLKNGYRAYCSRTCPEYHKGISIKRKETLVKRYGSDNPMKVKSFKEKASNTIKTKYGVDNVSQVDEFKEKRKETNKERYGVDNVFKLDETKQKIKETNLKKYGTEHAIQSKEVIDKVKATNIEKLGVEYSFQSEEVKTKIKKTNLERYGVEYAIQSEEVKAKMRETNLKHLGVEYPMQSKEVFEKSKASVLERYGVDHISKDQNIKLKKIEASMDKYGVPYVLQSSEIKDLIKRTNLERYGTEYTLQSEDVRTKSAATMLFRYGVENYNQTEEFKEKFRKKVKERILSKSPTYELLGESKDLFKLKCQSGHVFEIASSLYHQRHRFNNVICTECNKVGIGSISQSELELRLFLSENNIEFEVNKRDLISPFEIDIFIPSLNMGIEFNGLYWHSSKFKSDDYHLNKTKMMNEKGFRLIHIFEDEWVLKKEIVKSRLRTILNLENKRLYARKCIVKKISTKESSEFLNENHLQGSVGATHKIGLFYEGDLVSVMTFGNLRVNMGGVKSDGSYELLRFANKLNLSVIGGAGKLFKYFLTHYNYNEVISYADIRFSDINPINTVYSKLGFNYDHTTKPNYFYVKGVKRENRYKYRKSELIRMGFDPKLTEREITESNEMFRIYDTGHHKFKYKR